MACVLGVEPGPMIDSRETRKRYAKTSPMDPNGKWTLKRTKNSCPTLKEIHGPVLHEGPGAEYQDVEGMNSQMSRDKSHEADDERRAVVDRNQPQQQP